MQSGLQYRNILKSARALSQQVLNYEHRELESLSFYPVLSITKNWGSAVLCGPLCPGGKVRGRQRWPCGQQGSLCPMLFQPPCVAAAVAEPARTRGAAAGLLRLGGDHRGRFSKAWLALLALSSALVPPHITAVFSPFSRDLACPCSEVWQDLLQTWNSIV